MKRIKIIAVLLAGFFGVSSVSAQEVLTLQQAIKYALENKADAKKSALDLENAQYKIDEVRAGALPQVNFNGGVTYNVKVQKSAIDLSAMGGFGGGGAGASDLDGNLTGQLTDANGNNIGSISGGVKGEVTPKTTAPPVPAGLTLVGFGTPWSSQNSISLNQQIFNQALFTGLKAAKSTREFYQINKELTDEQLIEKVSNSYYEVYQTQLQLQTVQNNLDNTTKTRDVIKGLVDAGLAKKIDLDRTEVAINNLKAQKSQIMNALELRENALKFAIGMDIKQAVALPEETFEIDASIALEDQPIMDDRTELRLLSKQSELLELNKKSIVSQYYPTLSLSANYGVLGFSNSFFLFKPKESVWADFSTIGLNLSIPIFTGGATKSKVNQANIEIRRAKVDYEETKLGLDLAKENAKAQVKNSLLTINSNRSNVTLAKEVLSDTENNYKNGLATLTELLDAENAYADAQNNLNTSLLNFKVAEIQLIKSKGQLKTLVNEK